jgi:cell cycle arrest protein BUB3
LAAHLRVVDALLQCHRRTENGVDVVSPVNAVAYNPLFGTFATGGGDGVVNIWDGNNKKRLFQVRCQPGSCLQHQW